MLTIVLLRYYLHMICNQVLEDSPSELSATGASLAPCWLPPAPPPPLPRKVGLQQLQEWEWGERPARCNPFSQVGFGSPLFTHNNSNYSLLSAYREPHRSSFILTTMPRSVVGHSYTHFKDELIEVLSGQDLGQETSRAGT